MPQMRDDDAAANDQSHVERFVEFVILSAGIHALDDMVIDAIIAAQHH